MIGKTQRSHLISHIFTHYTVGSKLLHYKNQPTAQEDLDPGLQNSSNRIQWTNVREKQDSIGISHL